MLAALVLSAVLSSAPGAGPEDEEPGFFDTNWPTALDNELHPEIYDKRVFLWVVSGATWLIGGAMWAPGLVLKVEAPDEHTDEALWAWLTQLAPVCLCGPLGPVYLVFATLYLAPVRSINLYNAFVQKAAREPKAAAEPSSEKLGLAY